MICTYPVLEYSAKQDLLILKFLTEFSIAILSDAFFSVSVYSLRVVRVKPEKGVMFFGLLF